MPSSDMRPPTRPRVAWLATPAPDQLPEQVATEIGPIAERIGFVPNIARLLAVTPRHFVGWWRYFDELMRGPSNLTKTQREMITVSKRMRAKLSEVSDELKRRRHEPIPVQGRWLASVVRGHQAYYAVPGNTDAMNGFREQLTRYWYRALRRRSQRSRINWERMMDRIAARWLPRVQVMHPFPEVRFAATHPR